MDEHVARGLREKAKRIRVGVVEALGLNKSGHLGGSMSAADIMAVLYFHKMRIDPANPANPDRDRFIMSKGHSVLAQYAALAEAGYFGWSELANTKTLGSMLQGHPEIHIPGIEANTGSLGQGLSVGVGMAIAGKIDKASWKVYVLTGDAELAEGQIWEAAAAASHHRLDNLRAIVDANGISAMGKTCERFDLGDLALKFGAFGWHVIAIDGHDVEEIAAALDRADAIEGRPTAIVCKTVKGKGVSFAEDSHVYHAKAIDEAERKRALDEIMDRE